MKNKSQHYYSLGGSVLQRVSNNPYLSIEFSEDLKWSTHISKVTKKASSTIGFLRRNLSHCPTACRRIAYLSLVRSVIEYGAIVSFTAGYRPTNILDSQVTNNSKCFQVPPSRTDQYKHSFFIRTVIDWNHLTDDIADAPSTEAFRSRLANSLSCSQVRCTLSPLRLYHLLVLQRIPAEAEEV